MCKSMSQYQQASNHNQRNERIEMASENEITIKMSAKPDQPSGS